jgi:hypothetical protein
MIPRADRYSMAWKTVEEEMEVVFKQLSILSLSQNHTY